MVVLVIIDVMFFVYVQSVGVTAWGGTLLFLLLLLLIIVVLLDLLVYISTSFTSVLLIE